MDNNTLTQNQETAVANVEKENLPVSAIDFNSTLDSIDELLDDSSEAVSITAEYFPFEKAGDKTRGVFLGYREVNFKDDEATLKAGGEQQYREGTAVAWITKNRECFIGAGIALVNEFQRNNIAIGTPVQIELTGKKERTKTFRVSILVKRK